MSLDNSPINQFTDFDFDSDSFVDIDLNDFIEPSTEVSSPELDDIVYRSFGSSIDVMPIYVCPPIDHIDHIDHIDSVEASPIKQTIHNNPRNCAVQISKKSYEMIAYIETPTSMCVFEESNFVDILLVIQRFFIECNILYEYSHSTCTFYAQVCYDFGLTEFDISLNQVFNTNTYVAHFINKPWCKSISNCIFYTLYDILKDIKNYHGVKSPRDISLFNINSQMPRFLLPVTKSLSKTEKHALIFRQIEKLNTPYDNVVFNLLETMVTYTQPTSCFYEIYSSSGPFLATLTNIICSRKYSIQTMTLAAFMVASFCENYISRNALCDELDHMSIFKSIFDYLTSICTSDTSYFTRQGFQKIHDYQIENLRRFSTIICRFISPI